MLIFDENTTPIILGNVQQPTLVDYFWVLDLNMMDFTITPLLVLEEIICKTIELRINGFQFIVPAKWHVLIVDPSTMQLDVVIAGKMAGTEFHAFVYGPNEPLVRPARVSVSNFYNRHMNVGPALNKHQMLCHPISNDTWVCLSASDPYKYLKNTVAGHLI